MISKSNCPIQFRLYYMQIRLSAFCIYCVIISVDIKFAEFDLEILGEHAVWMNVCDMNQL